MSILQGRLIQRGGGHPEKVTRGGIKSVDIGCYVYFYLVRFPKPLPSQMGTLSSSYPTLITMRGKAL